MAFTEQGVAMLSSVLRSKVAMEVNISIMRAFVFMRQMVIGYEELLKRIEELEPVQRIVSSPYTTSEPVAAAERTRPIGFATYDRSGNK